MTKQLADFYATFGDETRIKILLQLLKEESTVSDLARVCNLTISNISHQLKVLKKHKLVKSRKDGKYNFYSLDDDHVKIILSYGIEHINE